MRGPLKLLSTILLEASASRTAVRRCVEIPFVRTRRELFLKSYQIKPKSDCIYRAPIDLEQQTDTVR